MSPSIISRQEWGARSAKERNPFQVPIRSWFVHWVGSHDMHQHPTLEQSKQLMRSLQEDAMDEGYDDFEYNFAVDPEGRIFEGRGFVVQGGATLHNNTDSWAVVYLAGPGTELTDKAIGAITSLTQEGHRRQSTCIQVRPHSAVFATQCPGDELRAHCSLWTQHLTDPPFDWGPIIELAEWEKRLTAKPLRYEDPHNKPKDVLILKALLDNHGFDTFAGPVYGDKVREGVHNFKLRAHIKPADGKVCGGRCAKALLTKK